MKILGIDTSTTLFSICLNDDDKVLFELRRERTFYKQSKDAGFFITAQELIKTIEVLDVIAIAIGPGMFTSLRVGLGFAKGLHLSQNIPICGVNTLDVIGKTCPFFAFTGNQRHRIIWVPIIEAFQGEIYGALYDKNSKIDGDFLTTPTGLIDYLNIKLKKYDKVVIIGPGAKVFNEKDFIKRKTGHKIEYVVNDSDIYYPSASKVVTVALERIRNKDFDNPNLLEPYYIKRVAAEAKQNHQ